MIKLSNFGSAEDSSVDIGTQSLSAVGVRNRRTRHSDHNVESVVSTRITDNETEKILKTLCLSNSQGYYNCTKLTDWLDRYSTHIKRLSFFVDYYPDKLKLKIGKYIIQLNGFTVTKTTSQISLKSKEIKKNTLPLSIRCLLKLIRKLEKNAKC